MATFARILVAKTFFHSPWRLKWSQLGALSCNIASGKEKFWNFSLFSNPKFDRVGLSTNISNRKDSVSSGYPSNKKRIENMMHLDTLDSTYKDSIALGWSSTWSRFVLPLCILTWQWMLNYEYTCKLSKVIEKYSPLGGQDPHEPMAHWQVSASTGLQQEKLASLEETLVT